MNNKKTSIFNLIEIFGQPRKKTQPIIAAMHCNQKYHHDFYCEGEKQKSI